MHSPYNGLGVTSEKLRYVGRPMNREVFEGKVTIVLIRKKAVSLRGPLYWFIESALYNEKSRIAKRRFMWLVMIIRFFHSTAKK